MSHRKFRPEKKKGKGNKRRNATKEKASPSDKRLCQELLKAVTDQSLHRAQRALQQGADPNCRDGNYRTPLFRITTIEIVRLLVNAGADVNARDQNGNVPLFWTLHPWFEDQTIAGYLIRAGADVNARNDRGESLVDLIPKSVASALENNIANSHIAFLKQHGYKD